MKWALHRMGLIPEGIRLPLTPLSSDKYAILEAALATAQSNLGAAQATTNASKSNIASTQSGISTVDAQIEAAKVNVWRTTQDYNRYSNLIKDHSITQQQFEQAQAAKETAEKQLQILIQQKN